MLENSIFGFLSTLQRAAESLVFDFLSTPQS